MTRLIMIWAVACLLLSSTAASRTWHIRADGSGDAPTIQAGIDSASAGDTVLVHPGEYPVNLYMENYISLVSAEGPDVTILRNDQGDGYAIVYAPCRGALIKGFRFLGEPGKNGQGIAAYCYSSEFSAEVTGNIFEDLVAYEGGGIICYNSRMIITDNEFHNCTGWNAGGGVGLFYDARALIQGNTFVDCYSKAGGAICCSHEGTCEILVNIIEDNEALEGGGGIYLHQCPSGTVEGNLFKGNQSGISGGGAYFYEGSYEVRYNVFWANRARYGGGIAQAPEAALTCGNNTFYRNEGTDRGSAADLRGDVASTFMNCIVSNCSGVGAVDCFGTTLPTVDCNVFYMNPSDYVGCSPGPHDINACPSFCFADQGDFTLCDQSPCLPWNHPYGDGCGLVGAVGEGCTCDPTKSQPTSWGGIKAMYR